LDIQFNPAASIAGTGRAAARGGEAESQASEAARQQSTAETPAGKSPDQSAVDAGQQTEDRDGHGQQSLDIFERRKQQPEDSDAEGKKAAEDEADDQASESAEIDRDEGEPGGHLDLQA
jgi:hypothetical protein